jgi:hypothetical protein
MSFLMMMGGEECAAVRSMEQPKLELDNVQSGCYTSGTPLYLGSVIIKKDMVVIFKNMAMIEYWKIENARRVRKRCA